MISIYENKYMERGLLMDRLYVYYGKNRNIVRRRGILSRLGQGLRVAALILACYGWWGVIYPELTMLPSTYEIVYEEQEQAEETKAVQKDAEVIEWNSDNRIYWQILQADPEQIRYKSRLLTMLKQ